MTATEDRILHAVTISKSGDQIGVETSFSSTTAFISNSLTKVDSTKSPVFAVADTETEIVAPEPLGIEWDSGEEIHIHTRNNTGASVGYRVLLYYRER